MTAVSNIVEQKTAATGTGSLALQNVPGRRGFHAAFGAGGSDMFFYFICHKTADEWEVGTGHMSDAAVLVRDTVISSSNGGEAVDFSAGEKTVVNDIPAERQLVLPAGADAGDLLCHNGAVWARLTKGAAGHFLRSGAEAPDWHGLTTDDVAGLAAALGEKAATAHGHDIDDVTGLNAALDARQEEHAILSALAALDATTGILEQTGAASFARRAIGTSSGDALPTRADADARYAAATHTHGSTADIAGLDAALATKAMAARQMATTGSIIGGGDLSADRTLQLAGDDASPAAGRYYGTDGSGDKGFHALPAVPSAAAEISFDDSGAKIIAGATLQAAVSAADVALRRGGFHPQAHASVNHFCGTAQTGPFSAATSGTAATASTQETNSGINAAALGVMRLGTGSTSAGVGMRSGGVMSLLPDAAGKIIRTCTRVRLEDLTGVSSQEFRCYGGLLGGTTVTANPNSTQGVYWYYDADNADWRLLRRTGVTSTSVSTGVTVAADTWYDMELEIIGAADEEDITTRLYINGALVATVTGLTGGVAYNPVAGAIQKTSGTTARLMYMDYEALLLERWA